MSLIKSISGFRGTIGGKPGDNLTPIDAVKFAAAYGTWLKNQSSQSEYKVIIGRDARISGQMISQLVCSTLQGLGINVVDLGLSTTPTVEVMVTHLNADGGIILTASHNPKEWNALKLLNAKGEFVSSEDGAQILSFVDKDEYTFAEVDHLGTYETFDDGIDLHIDKILALPLVDAEAIKKKNFKVAIDAVNSTGGIAIPKLLERLGVTYYGMYCEPNGQFPHNPEPLKEHLGDICKKVIEEGADFGVVVDPDVDRLAIIDEKGEMFGEEYTLVAIADYVLSKTPSATVSNLSSSRALRDVTERYNQNYSPSAVGEVNVVVEMKNVNAKIGGEGNGGIIYPELHYGRDSLVGIALFLTQLAEQEITVSELRKTYPAYYMAKKKIELTPEINVDELLVKIQDVYKNEQINTVDGVKIDFPTEWVHLRKSNTEPIIRIYTESTSEENANKLADKMIESIKNII
ncbi:phosphomannomutase [Chishuiella changwenlii]|uniref:Phosphoglucosamine mutase n=1 Tax=Chishuiella changwenlii TaxID=1434701 RepID=A0A1M6U2A0_9FLAO|nr:phosphoglucosamine mutase [Chishuiella changwenlii]GGF08768.1 phosphoglucosamine mutase [Chishuiella changwenlii]SHK63402.1 phosphomannomutase [Chishuiella changwenlii]